MGWIMDGPGPQVKGRRILEAMLAASLLCGLSVLVVGRPHPQASRQLSASMRLDTPVSESMQIIPRTPDVDYRHSAP